MYCSYPFMLVLNLFYCVTLWGGGVTLSAPKIVGDAPLVCKFCQHSASIAMLIYRHCTVVTVLFVYSVMERSKLQLDNRGVVYNHWTGL